MVEFGIWMLYTVWWLEGDFGFRVQGAGCRVQDEVEGLGFRV
jgi:hypothetical protein